jgi:replicative DNA helicase
MKPPHSLEAERSVIGQMMAGGTKIAGEVIGTQLSPIDFYAPTHQIIFEAIYNAYFEDDPIDPLSIGEVASKRLAKYWSCDENDAIVRVRDMAVGVNFTGKVLDHSKVVKSHAHYRKLIDLANSMLKEVGEEVRSPEEIAGIVSHQAMRIATDSLLTHDLIGFGDLGRRYYEQATTLMKAREQGVELGAYFGLPFLDRYMRGLQPTELLIVAGEPGVGKSAVMWKAALKFAERQSSNAERQIGTLILSLEMGEGPSNIRLAQTLAKVNGSRLREGNPSKEEFARIVHEWGERKDLPLWFNFTSHMRASQMRALIVEAIRRHNVGLVVIDHMRYFDMDDRYPNQTEEDEAKARFLKESIAKDLNCAVVCIAHTTKGIENTPDRRPELSHLRGSGQVAAHADFVSFVYRPYKYADEGEKLNGAVNETDAEMIWRKNRHGLDGIEPFFFKPETMDIR